MTTPILVYEEDLAVCNDIGFDIYYSNIDGVGGVLNSKWSLISKQPLYRLIDHSIGWSGHKQQLQPNSVLRVKKGPIGLIF